MSVLKPFHMRSLGVNRVQAYETLSSTEAAASPSFVPNVYRDITSSPRGEAACDVPVLDRGSARASPP